MTPMNERISKLRQKSLDRRPYLSPERAQLLTEFYRTGIPERTPVPVARALAFAHILDNKELFIDTSLEDDLPPPPP